MNLNWRLSLYPLLEATIRIGEKQPPILPEQIYKFKIWLAHQIEKLKVNGDRSIHFSLHPAIERLHLLGMTGATEQSGSCEDVSEAANFPELDNYHFVRPGLRWEIFARDNWTCCSCGRNPKNHGVTLEVDHIIPRSKGGTDDKSNLQTLCKKCNIGKSNRDSTNLTV